MRAKIISATLVLILAFISVFAGGLDIEKSEKTANADGKIITAEPYQN